jgi:hypothetical protein
MPSVGVQSASQKAFGSFIRIGAKAIDAEEY